MPKFNDANSLEDIVGCTLLAESWPQSCNEVDVHQLLIEITERIGEKLLRNKNPIRSAWFVNAKEFVQQARTCYDTGDLNRGRELLAAAREQLESGNKAHRRKTAFIVDPDGNARLANPT